MRGERRAALAVLAVISAAGCLHVDFSPGSGLVVRTAAPRAVVEVVLPKRRPVAPLSREVRCDILIEPEVETQNPSWYELLYWHEELSRALARDLVSIDDHEDTSADAVNTRRIDLATPFQTGIGEMVRALFPASAAVRSPAASAPADLVFSAGITSKWEANVDHSISGLEVQVRVTVFDPSFQVVASAEGRGSSQLHGRLIATQDQTWVDLGTEALGRAFDDLERRLRESSALAAHLRQGAPSG